MKKLLLVNAGDEALSVAVAQYLPGGLLPEGKRRIVVPGGSAEIPIELNRVEIEAATIGHGHPAAPPKVILGRSEISKPVEREQTVEYAREKLPSAFQSGDTAILRGRVTEVHFSEGKVHYVLTLNPHPDIEVRVPSECLSRS